MNLLLNPQFRGHAAAAAKTGFPCAVVPLLLIGMMILALPDAQQYDGNSAAAENISLAFFAAAGGLSLLLLALGALLLATKNLAHQSQAIPQASAPAGSRPAPEPFRNAAGLPLTRAELKQAYRCKKQEAEQFMWRAALPCAVMLFAHFCLLFFTQGGNHQFFFWSLIPLALFLAGMYLAVKHHSRLEAEAKELRRQRRAAPRQSQFPV